MITEVYSRDRWFYISKSVNMTYYINKIKVKNFMTFLIDNEKAFDKIQHPFIIKISISVYRENILQHIRSNI